MFDWVPNRPLTRNVLLECEYALGLLEKYHGQLHAENDQKVKEELETVISIFKSNLFGALIGMWKFFIKSFI